MTSILRLWDHQGGQCWYCGGAIGRDVDRVIGPGGELELPAHLAAAELDHQIPRSRGGGRGPNLVLACRPCNGAKGSMTVEEYRGELGNYRGGEVVFSGEAA